MGGVLVPARLRGAMGRHGARQRSLMTKVRYPPACRINLGYEEMEAPSAKRRAACASASVSLANWNEAGRPFSGLYMDLA